MIIIVCDKNGNSWLPLAALFGPADIRWGPGRHVCYFLLHTVPLLAMTR